MTYQISKATWGQAVERFLETGGAPPDGVTLLNRYHAAAGRHGFLVAESDDVAALYRMAAEWHDVCDLAITPVIEDEEAGAVLQSMQ